MANVYSRALMDHVSNPDYKYKMEDATYSHEGINPSCGDDLVLDVRLGDDGKIAEVSWTGSGCAVSQGSAWLARRPSTHASSATSSAA